MQPQQIPDVLLSLLNVPDLVILAVVLVNLLLGLRARRTRLARRSCGPLHRDGRVVLSRPSAGAICCEMARRADCAQRF